MFFRNASTTDNDTTSTNNNTRYKGHDMVSQKQHYTFFNKGHNILLLVQIYSLSCAYLTNHLKNKRRFKLFLF